MTSRGQCAPSATATAVLPTAVGPTSTGTLPAAKSALQLLARELDDRGAPVHVVGRQVGAEQSQEQLAHLPFPEPVTRFHGGSTGVGGSKALQSIGPAAEAPPRQISHHFAEAGAGVEPRVRCG